MTNEFPPLIYGGLGTAVGGLVNALCRFGINAAVLLIGDSGRSGYSDLTVRANQYHSGGRSTKYNSFPSIFQFSWYDDIQKLIQLVQMWKPDVLHLHSFWLFHLARTIKEKTGVPIVYTVHSLDRAEYDLGLAPPFVLSQSFTQEAAIALADRVIALSRDEKDLLLAYYPEAKERVRIVGNGIDENYAMDHGFITKSHRNAFAHPTVLYAGRFVDRKGIRDLLAAIPMVLKLAPLTRFVFVGGQPGSTGQDMERWWLPEFLFPYREQIKFTGWVQISELIYWYNNANILVVPSWYEPFGMVILEGMVHELAIIATTTGGPMEILEHGRTALLFPPKDIKTLAECIVLFTENRELQRQIAAAALKEVREKWIWTKVFEKMLNVYLEVAW